MRLIKSKYKDMYEQILLSIKTKDDKEIILEEVLSLKDTLFQENGIYFDSILKTKVRSWISALLRDELDKSGLAKLDYFDGLYRELKKIKEVGLVIAFEPSQDFIDRMSEFLKQIIGSSVILNITYDPYIIGGAQIIYKGVYKDYSFKRIFEKEFFNFEVKLNQLLEKNEN
ncbi:hypothetical protein A2159_02435 [Candidatus Woesebacteria bacterium RBG_13_34_9]|uniref:Uncharacterized protein n=1 Tax=Candidatus Woesebacteria bacterium RBG_13_34_9 TaxID=1802477 RepID=A0A1F7X6R3_9BACT|nr:MAG: hypothetical protein A2159_02435 [Candidatus Woesebacteria bacterium RBG_13_34_9]